MDGAAVSPYQVLSDQILSFLIILILVLLVLATLFAAFTFLLRFRNDRAARIWSDRKSRWEPILFEVTADPDSVADLWEAVEEGDEEVFLDFLLEYAHRLGGTEGHILRQAAEPYLPGVVPKLKHRRLGTRARAAQTLGILGLPGYSKELRTSFDDPSPFVAAIAARLLAHEVGAEVATDLCRSLDRFEYFRSWYLVDLMVALGQSAVPEIRAALENPEYSFRTRAVAAHALSVLQDLGSADLAAELASRETNAELLSGLFRLLTQVGTSRHAPAARQHLDSPAFFVRAGATGALGELGSAEDLPLLVERLGDPSAWVRMAAAGGIYRLGGRKAVAPFMGPKEPTNLLFRQVLAEAAG
jgi:HEAT repeat protein